MNELLSINIGMDPELFEVFGFLITWHGVFTAVGIVAGVWVAVWLAQKDRIGIDIDTAYTIGLIVVGCGLVGARALYVIENWGAPNLQNFWDIFAVTEGGISVYGAILGGALGGWAYGLYKRLPAAAGADAAVFGMLLGLGIGRIGDIINGEHFSKESDLPWATYYTHVNSPAFFREPHHPAVAYEMIGDFVIIGILAIMWRLNPKSGVLFVSGFLMYAVMRFFVSFLRLDSEYPIWGLNTPQVISVIIMILGVPLLLYFLARKEPGRPGEGARVRPGRSISRSERRRRLRSGPTNTQG